MQIEITTEKMMCERRRERLKKYKEKLEGRMNGQKR